MEVFYLSQVVFFFRSILFLGQDLLEMVHTISHHLLVMFRSVHNSIGCNLLTTKCFNPVLPLAAPGQDQLFTTIEYIRLQLYFMIHRVPAMVFFLHTKILEIAFCIGVRLNYTNRSSEESYRGGQGLLSRHVDGIASTLAGFVARNFHFKWYKPSPELTMLVFCA